MTTTTHTPGPWIYDSRYNNVIDEDGRVIAARPSYSSADVDTEMADMRLIAAAPALKDALADLLAEVERLPVYQDAVSAKDKPLLAALIKATKAITLATGG